MKMKRSHKYLGWMLLVPALILLAGARLTGLLVLPVDPDGRRAFRELSREIRAHPNQDQIRVTRIVDADLLERALSDVEARGGDLKVIYSRHDGILREGNGNGLTQRWEHVTPEAIHAIAAANGTWSEMARHGAINAPL